MGHMTDGALRRYLDEPGSMSGADRAHLASCARCGAEARAAGQARDDVRAVLDEGVAGPPGLDVMSDLDDAWARLSAGLERADAAPEPVPVTRIGSRRRSARFQVAAGVTAGLLVIGGTAAAAAANWLPVFRTDAVAPVTVSQADVSSLSSFAGLGELSDYGDLKAPTGAEPEQVADAATATTRTGVAVPRTGALPQGVTGSPTVYVLEHQTATFTFSAAKAERAAAGRGVALPAVPDGLDGSTLKLDVGPAVAQVWGRDGGPPTLVVARSVAPVASSQGASPEQLRDYLLSVPGLPPDLVAQLRTVSADGRTLPIPVLQAEMSSSQTDVGGVPATVLRSSGGFGAGVIWASGDRLTVVAGTLDDDEVLGVARGLR